MTRAEAIELAADRIAWFFAEHDTPTDAATAAVDALLEAGTTFGEEAEATITGLREAVDALRAEYEETLHEVLDEHPIDLPEDYKAICACGWERVTGENGAQGIGNAHLVIEFAKALARPEFPDTEKGD